MEEKAERLRCSLVEKFGPAVKFSYVDVESVVMKDYPKIAVVLGQYLLPLTVLNGELKYHAGFPAKSIENAVQELLAEP